MKKGAAEASPSVETSKSDSNDSDAWRVNVDKVIEKLGEDDLEGGEGRCCSLLHKTEAEVFSADFDQLVGRNKE